MTARMCTIRDATSLYVPLGFRSSMRLIASESRTEKRPGECANTRDPGLTPTEEGL